MSENNTTPSGMPVPPPQRNDNTAVSSPAGGVQSHPVAGAPTTPPPPHQAPMGAQQPHVQPSAYHQPAHAQMPIHPPVPPKKSGGGAKTFLLAFLGAALAMVIGFSGLGLYSAFSGDSGDSGSVETILGAIDPNFDFDDVDATLAEAVAAKTLPSVVNIDVFTTQSDMGMFGFGGSGEGTLIESSLGSGVILSEDGYIITNYHVIEGAEALEVTIGDDTYQADIVGTDPSSDLAVIKVQNASGLTPVEIGSSSDLSIGEWVMTIGSPFGLEQSVATGIVSAVSRSEIMESSTGEATVYSNLIQTDAAINPGNSGGALVDAEGKLIGINTLITSSSGNYSGVGFAIPVDYAISIAQQIIEGGNPTHAQLGVALSSVNTSLAERYGLAVNSGAYVTQVYSNSGAAQAGIEVGDIIVAFDGKTIASASDLMIEVRGKNPGDTVSVEVNRDGTVNTVDITLGSDATTQQQSSRQSGFDNSAAVKNAA